jgi:hypothetical protein
MLLVEIVGAFDCRSSALQVCEGGESPCCRVCCEAGARQMVVAKIGLSQNVDTSTG